MRNTNIIFKADGKIPPPTIKVVSENITIQEAAILMREKKCSVLRIGRNGKTESIISAYDIVVNMVAFNKTAATTKVCDTIPERLAAALPSSNGLSAKLVRTDTSLRHSNKPE